MPFLAPLALLLLAPLGGLIVLLYMLRLKRRDVIVPSVMLWEAILQDTQANAPFQKLKKNLLLFLQLAAILLLVFIVARPFIWSTGMRGRTTAIIVDGSASMRATDVSGGRFAEALRQAEALIKQKGSGDAAAVVLAAEKPVVLCPLTTDREKLLTSLKRAYSTDAPHDMKEAISLAASLVASRAESQVTVVTDGAFGRLDEMALGGPKLGFVLVGTRGENVAITAFDVRDTLGGGTGRQAFVTVQNFSKGERKVPLEVRVNGKLADAHELVLKPGETKSENFDDLRADAGGIVQAHLDVRDDLSADNEAWVTLAPRRAVRILLVTEGNPFLERVLNTDERVELEAVKPTDYKPTDSDKRDMTVFDDAAPPTNLLPGRYLFWGLGSVGASLVPATAATGEANQPQILDWSRTHPLMRFVDLANVKLMRAKNVTAAPWATSLAETDAGPLIVAGERNDSRVVYVGFTLLESDMPLRVAFPIFLTNCIQWLTARPGDSGGVTKPGEVMLLAATPDNGTLTITRPDKGTDTLAVTPSSPPLYDRTTSVGVYKANGKDFEQHFAVSLLSPTESNCAPVSTPSVVVTDTADEKTTKDGKPATPTTERGIVSRQEVWPYIALAALLLLAAEWYVYHKRIG